MSLEQYVGANVKIIFDDDTVIAHVINYTPAADNEADDDGNYGGECLSVKLLQDSKYLPAEREFSVYKYEIKSISEIKSI